MDGKRLPAEQQDPSGAPAGEEPSPRAAPPVPAEPDATPQRFGPLALTRLRKADGRHLISYARPATSEAPEGPG